MQELEEFRESGPANPLNQDNQIFQSKRIFRYGYEYTDPSGQERIITARFNEDCRKDRNVKCIDWANVLPEDTNYSHEFPIEYLELYVYRTTSNDPLAREQTMIKYDYFNKRGKILMGEQTGVVENEDRIFLHPPRMFGFAVTEFNPFPMIRFDTTAWHSQISIPAKMVAKTRLADTSFASFDIHYRKKERVPLKTGSFGELSCHLVHAKSHGELGDTELKAYFHEEYGFVKLQYMNLDCSRLTLQLQKVS